MYCNLMTLIKKTTDETTKFVLFYSKKNSHEATGGCVEEKYSPAA